MSVILFILGLCTGSFVNALVWRLKKKKNWVSERSVCIHCGHILSPLDLVPIFSYLFLRGRCRYCHKKIEDSPFTEIGLGLAYLLSYIFWPYTLSGSGLISFILWLVALIILCAMFVYDLRWTLLPDKLTRALLTIAALQIIVLLVTGDLQITNTPTVIASVFVGGGIFHLIYEFSKGQYIGGGDVKLGYAYGLLLLDPLISWMVLAIASLLGSIIAISLIILKKKSFGSKLPFGPMLIIGVFISMVFGQSIWSRLNVLMLY